ncbi:hypothetical protein HY485_02660 [Candidatus Woesearchaeota archaeon]|nr:hypothetical protein [Candidatus Woesearchaeota archaeon]
MNDENPIERHWYLLPFVRVAAVVGILGVTLGGMQCYQYLKSNYENTKQEIPVRDAEQKTIDKLVK